MEKTKGKEQMKIIKIAAEGTGLHSIKTFAWQAVALTVIALLIYIAALLCMHIAAFRVQANMRISLMKRILTLPLGVFDDEGTGRIRRIVNDSTAATETYIAHNLPDKTVAAVTPIGLCVLIFAFNWKIGLFCMIPAVILILIALTNYIQYNATFLSTYRESGIRRTALAEKLRKLPLSYFGKKNIADLTTNIMGDCAQIETACLIAGKRGRNLLTAFYRKQTEIIGNADSIFLIKLINFRFMI